MVDGIVSKDLLHNYLKALSHEYVMRGENSYPVDMSSEGWIGVLGLPNLSYAFRFGSRDELYGRILVLAHLLGVSSLYGEVNGVSVEVKL